MLKYEKSWKQYLSGSFQVTETIVNLHHQNPPIAGGRGNTQSLLLDDGLMKQCEVRPELET